MRKEPLRDTNKWLNKLFFPRLLAATAFRYVFRNSGRRLSPETAQKITHALTFGYVGSACTLAGLVYVMWSRSGMSSTDVEANALYFAKLATRAGDMDDPEKKIVHYRVFEGKKVDITEQVREHHLGKHDESYDKYSDHDYVKRRLNIKTGSVAEENFDPDVAGVYLRRVDTYNKIGK